MAMANVSSGLLGEGLGTRSLQGELQRRPQIAPRGGSMIVEVNQPVACNAVSPAFEYDGPHQFKGRLTMVITAHP